MLDAGHRPYTTAAVHHETGVVAGTTTLVVFEDVHDTGRVQCQTIVVPPTGATGWVC